MQLPPTKVLLNWPIPNYVDPPTRGLSLIVVNAIFMTLITLAVPIRVIGRFKKMGRLGTDDIFIIFAYISSMGLGTVVILANVRYQWNRHLWDVQFDMFQRASIMAMVAKILFTFAATFTRASLISFYFRLIEDTGLRVFYWILWAAQIYNYAIFVTFFFLTVFLCTPVEAYWVFPLIHGSKCLTEGPVTLAAGVLNCISDLMVTILPIPIVMGLNMPLRQRMGVIVLLSLGFIVTIAGGVRTYFIWKTLMDTYDETWDSMPLYICATVEIDIAVLCACAPSLKPLFAPMIHSVTEMISTIAHNHSNTSASRGDTLIQSVSRSVTVSHHRHEVRTAKGDKIPMTYVTVNGSGSEASVDKANQEDTESRCPGQGPAQSCRRSRSRASSQRTILAQSIGTLSCGIEEGCEDEETVVGDMNSPPRHHNHDHDIEKNAWNTSWPLQ